jgi:hypothetical protein
MCQWMHMSVDDEHTYCQPSAPRPPTSPETRDLSTLMVATQWLRLDSAFMAVAAGTGQHRT